MAIKRYESSAGTSSKFWEIDQKGSKVVVRWGPIGGKASTKTHSFASADEATKKHDALVREKTKRGYRVVVPAVSAPRPKPKPVKPASVSAALKKQLAVARDKLEEARSDSARAALPTARDMLGVAGQFPYGTADGLREDAEIEVLLLMLEAGAKQEATTLWLRLIDDWSAAIPPRGGNHWFHLAEAHQQLGSKIPAKMRDRVRSAWATGGVSFIYHQASGPSVPRRPKDSYEALTQASTEIRHHEFDRARACLDVARKKWRGQARILDVVLLHEQGDRSGADHAFRTLVNEAQRDDEYGNWSVVAALLVYIGAEDSDLAKQVLAAWKKRARISGGDAYSSIFEA